VPESKEKLPDENPGAAELMKKYKTYEAGLPFWLVLDKEGSLLEDSFMNTANGKSANIGCPASKTEVAAFIKILKSTSVLTGKELIVISAIF